MSDSCVKWLLPLWTHQYARDTMQLCGSDTGIPGNPPMPTWIRWITSKSYIELCTLWPAILIFKQLDYLLWFYLVMFTVNVMFCYELVQYNESHDPLIFLLGIPILGTMLNPFFFVLQQGDKSKHMCWKMYIWFGGNITSNLQKAIKLFKYMPQILLCCPC